MFQTTITQWASAYDFTLFYAFYQASAEVGYPLNSLQWWSVVAWSIFVGHWLFSKSIKLVPHFFRNPQDIRYLPVSILFGYFHNFIKLWGLLTLHEVSCSFSSFAAGMWPSHQSHGLSEPRMLPDHSKSVTDIRMRNRRPGVHEKARTRTIISECCQ